MHTLIENGEVYAPARQGRRSVLLAEATIAAVGRVNRHALESLGVEHEVVDVEGCLVTPGWIDPHVHLLGGSGEQGFSTQTPEFFVDEIVRYGFTTVVGCLGVDTTMKTMPGLLAKAKALEEEGLNARVWTGGYNVPATSILGSAREDIMFIDEIIGVGEVAIADKRGMEPEARELARLMTDAYVGGMLARKAGVTHFHVGEGKRRLEKLRQVLDEFEVEPSWIYATHIERSEALMREAIALAQQGAAVDIDTADSDLAHWLRFYLDNGGDPERLTVSSDASINSPRAFAEQVTDCIVNHGMPMEQVLPLVTSNTARVLKLDQKGTLERGNVADVLVLERDTLAVRHAWAKGRCMVRDGELVARAGWLAESKREVVLVGDESPARRTGEPVGA
ncbi:MAG: Isoaspartyl aminopeptidase @ Asp-X dipeptidase [uncultured Solirubrobacteraceae bacterium]|uniref:Isoaspartyl aminopeptidase @ Asp-X dipeptidase n=1 Tax=uncultured Solirubrobacteraceae bacterium TaxID=1162706 RepID=A0A6J4RQ63_9ACTN|nr:MAG: Isoaspartyl aminopeptidase @ Asp-X dipeptidase [uncultured Solirubrobacteraceae bacterium]